MRFAKSFVPYGAYWSTPFCKWQGSLAHLNATALGAESAKRALQELLEIHEYLPRREKNSLPAARSVCPSNFEKIEVCR